MTVTCFVQVFHGLQQLGIVVALVLAVYVRRLNRDLHEEVLALRRRQAGRAGGNAGAWGGGGWAWMVPRFNPGWA